MTVQNKGLGCDIGKGERWCIRSRLVEEKEGLSCQERKVSIRLIHVCGGLGKDYDCSVEMRMR